MRLFLNNLAFPIYTSFLVGYLQAHSLKRTAQEVTPPPFSPALKALTVSFSLVGGGE